MRKSICAGMSPSNRRETPTEQESLSQAEESTWVIIDINRWDLLKKAAPTGEGGVGVVEDTRPGRRWRAGQRKRGGARNQVRGAVTVHA